MTRRAGVLGVGTLTVLAALLRVPTLDRQSFWSDEAITALLTRMSFGEMLRVIPQTESTPPVYYVVAWLWARGFGDGEIGLRSLSALAGVATVPVAYVAGTALIGRRVGLAAAALVAVSPSLVWYSQEARSYALATLLCGASFAAFARVLSSSAMSPLVLWSTFSVLAIWTHYFAVFVVAAEAVWLLLSSSGKTVRRAVAATALGGVAVLPLALEQRANGFTELFGPSDRLSGRVIVVAKQLLVGQALPADRVVAGVAALIVAASLACILARGSRADSAPSSSLPPSVAQPSCYRSLSQSETSTTSTCGTPSWAWCRCSSLRLPGSSSPLRVLSAPWRSSGCAAS